VLSVKKKNINSKCRSCGNKGTHDSLHKVAAYIISHPPEDISEFKEKEDKDRAKPAKEVPKDTKKIITPTISKDPPIFALDKVKLLSYQLPKSLSESEIETSLFKLLSEHSLSKEYFYIIGIYGLFDESINTEWGKYVQIFNNRIEKDKEFGYMALLLSLEIFVCDKHPTLKNMVCTLLQTLYNSESLSEEILLNWADKKAKYITSLYKQEFDEYFLKESGPFLKWLKEAEVGDQEKSVEPKKEVVVDIMKLEVKQEVNLDEL